MKEIEQYLKKMIEKGDSPGVSYAFFDTNDILYSFQGGYARLESQELVNDRTSFHAFSVTKTFTALAVMQLAEQGKINLDQTLLTYLPQFSFLEEATIRQVLAHTGGIPSPIPLRWVHLQSEHPDFNEAVFFQQILLKYKKAKSRPNEKWSYSNLGYYLLGLLVEKVSGIPYKEYIQTKILAPLNLKPEELGFLLDDRTGATGYQRSGFLNFLLGFFFDKARFMEKSSGKWIPFKDFYINGAAFGGLLGTAKALATYGQALLKQDSPLLSEEYKKILFTPTISSRGKKLGICLCWYWDELKGNFYVEHIGGACGFYSELRLYPAIGKGSVLLMNRTGILPEKNLNHLDPFFL